MYGQGHFCDSKQNHWLQNGTPLSTDTVGEIKINLNESAKDCFNGK